MAGVLWELMVPPPPQETMKCAKEAARGHGNGNCGVGGAVADAAAVAACWTVFIEVVLRQ